jgi:hypothetical protein
VTDQIQFKRGTSSKAFTDNPVLAEGEPAVETDTGRLCIGDGVQQWEALPTIYTRNVLIDSGDGTISDHYKMCVFTGTQTDAWDLPPVDVSAGKEVSVFNRGTANLNVVPGGSDSMWAHSGGGAVTTYQMTPGMYRRFVCDGFFWLVCEA